MPITDNDRRRKITKREAVIKQLVIKSASSDARSLKILLDLMLKLRSAGAGIGSWTATRVAGEASATSAGLVRGLLTLANYKVCEKSLAFSSKMRQQPVKVNVYRVGVVKGVPK